MAEKLIYSMGEVAEIFDVRPSLLRHWETQFPVLRPRRNKKGNRLYSPEDVEKLKSIYHLVKERGMTLEGAKKALRKPSAGEAVSRDAELMERLQRIRSLLVEVREDLKAGQDGVVTDAAAEPVAELAAAQPAAKPRRTRAKAVVQLGENPEGEVATGEQPAHVRKPRRKKEDAEHKELFAFYEQSLF